MNKKITVALLISTLMLGACANTDVLSGSVYTEEQAKEERQISYGTIVSVRPVVVQADNKGVLGSVGGGVIGGIAGSTLGGGSGRAIMTTIGSMVGVAVGNVIENKVSQVNSLEMVIRKDDGKEIVVVQKAEAGFEVGKRVRLVGSANSLNVSPL